VERHLTPPGLELLYLPAEHPVVVTALDEALTSEEAEGFIPA
jgi:hypothetical protein